MADLLEVDGETHSPYVRQALAELSELTPRRILDIGSGPGVAACRMASVFPEAEVTAVDGTPELLARATERAARLGVPLRTQVAEFPAGLAGLGPADLVWTAQVVHHVGDQQGALDQLAGLLAPGGVLAVVEGGLPPRWLPRDLGFGRPGLQERLDVAMADRFSRMRAELPGAVPVVESWSGMLRAAGLTGVRGKTFLVDHPAPQAERPRAARTSHGPAVLGALPRDARGPPGRRGPDDPGPAPRPGRPGGRRPAPRPLPPDREDRPLRHRGLSVSHAPERHDGGRVPGSYDDGRVPGRTDPAGHPPDLLRSVGEPATALVPACPGRLRISRPNPTAATVPMTAHVPHSHSAP